MESISSTTIKIRRESLYEMDNKVLKKIDVKIWFDVKNNIQLKVIANIHWRIKNKVSNEFFEFPYNHE